MVSSERPTHALMRPGEISAALRELLENIHGDGRCMLAGEAYIGQAPGRLDVMGGIADYTGSLVCQMPLKVGTAVLAQKRTDRALVLQSYNNPNVGSAGPVSYRLSLDDFYGSGALLDGGAVRRLFHGEDHWAAYVAGIFWVLAKHRHLTGRALGANVICYSNVPLGAGLSSSAALEVAAINAIAGAYHLTLDPLEAAVLAQKVENQIAGAPCGIMDQMASSLGRAGQLLLLKCQPHTVVGYENLPPGTTVAALCSGVRHSVAGSAYTRVRVAAFMAHKIILTMAHGLGLHGDPTGGYLANVTPDFYRGFLRPILPRNMSGQDFIRRYQGTMDAVTAINPTETYAIRAAADHHILENQRVQRFAAALKNADGKDQRQHLRRAGRLMLASHASYTHRAGLGCPETDWLVRAVMAAGRGEGFYGAKITGGGGGGSVAVLMDDAPPQHQRLAEIVATYNRTFAVTAAVLCGSGPSAAEFGVRMLAGGKLVG